ncbi:MAG: hypothetical protein IJM44_00475 [Ruminococcus sp.]|nr:hypothetical protein [Ruminococcus sp.]
MSLFRHRKTLSLPEPFTADDIRTESSICTGETIIGFYDRSARKLMYAELVRSKDDISRFYAKYGLSCPVDEGS